MLDITILAFGRLKEDYYHKVAAEYIKRLKPYARLKIEELKAESFNDSNHDVIKKIEGRRLLERLSREEKSEIFLLAEGGREFSSEEFATWLSDKPGSLILVLGGTLGFSKEVYETYQQISLSRLTFPHELARVVLLEQIYRAAAIIRGKNYHY